MAEYIDREAALSLVQPDTPEDEKSTVTIATAKKLVRSIVYRTPTADVAPVRHGRWIKVGYACGETEWQCSACKETEWRTSASRLKYCPFCGAKMDEPLGNSDRLEDDK